MIALKTQRLYLRNGLSNDAEAIFDYRNHELCNRYQRGQTRDYKKIIQLIEHHKNDEISITHPFMIAVALNSNKEIDWRNQRNTKGTYHFNRLHLLLQISSSMLCL